MTDQASLPLSDPAPPPSDSVKILPGRRLQARVEGAFAAPPNGFETRAVDLLDLGFDGIAGDFHQGNTRRSGGREPWYPRGTEIRNERQVSIVSPDELGEIARRMSLPVVRPEWLGANLLLAGIPRLSMLPAGTLLFFKGGVTLKVDGQNRPCRIAGAAIAAHAGMTDRKAGALLFPRVAARLRGLVAWVEKPGRLVADEDVSVRIPEQWIYTP